MELALSREFRHRQEANMCLKTRILKGLGDLFFASKLIMKFSQAEVIRKQILHVQNHVFVSFWAPKMKCDQAICWPRLVLSVLSGIDGDGDVVETTRECLM